jgi:hypothetical protein
VKLFGLASKQLVNCNAVVGDQQRLNRSHLAVTVWITQIWIPSFLSVIAMYRYGGFKCKFFFLTQREKVQGVAILWMITPRILCSLFAVQKVTCTRSRARARTRKDLPRFNVLQLEAV